MKNLPHEVELEMAHETINSAMAYLRYRRNEGEFAPLTFWEILFKTRTRVRAPFPPNTITLEEAIALVFKTKPKTKK